MPKINAAGTEFFFTCLLVALIVLSAALSLLVFFSQNEKFSVIFLEQGNIPGKATVGVPVSFSFVVENRTGRTADYNLSVVAGGKTKLIGSFSLVSGEKKSFEESVVFNSAGEQKVLVGLEELGSSQEYSVFFWVAVSPAG